MLWGINRPFDQDYHPKSQSPTDHVLEPQKNRRSVVAGASSDKVSRRSQGVFKQTRSHPISIHFRIPGLVFVPSIVAGQGILYRVRGLVGIVGSLLPLLTSLATLLATVVAASALVTAITLSTVSAGWRSPVTAAAAAAAAATIAWPLH
ncbi:hypothetical protein EJ04DRAFT_355033 [Polyplosphaeria fusca]|uniref:Uncharacterized protein n=1 Tax=Polyplosphaeria fusca TaxID=682080 RepID=A0A9P4R8Q5_9PLEO|nr:hypothetical protein EJ04DRAFT_355033 [Polyplosphaeria fusca]